MRAHIIFRNKNPQFVVIGKPDQAQEKLDELKSAHYRETYSVKKAPIDPRDTCVAEYDFYHHWTVESVPVEIYQG